MPKPTFWVWEPDGPRRGTAFVTEIVGLGSADNGRLLRGGRLPRIPHPVAQDYTSGKLGDCLPNYMGILTLAPVLLRVVQAATKRVQCVPIKILRQSKLKYSIVNVLDVLPAIDVERSKLTYYEDTDVIARITKLVLRPMAEDGPAIFHAAEYLPLVLVNDDLRQRIQAASAHHGVLTPVGAWRNHV